MTPEAVEAQGCKDYHLPMRLMPFLKALLVAGLGFSVASALLTHQGVGVVEWLVGVGAVAALTASAVHFARQSIRAT
jgi:hypothetical protein